MTPCMIPLLYCLCSRNRPRRKQLCCCSMPVLTVIKRDADSQEPLSGSVFHLCSQRFPTASAMTEEDGSISFTLRPGVRYRLYEAEAPRNYEKDLRVYVVYANQNGQVFVNGHCMDTLVIANFICASEVSFAEVKADTYSEVPLKEIRFQLRYKDQVVAESSADEFGRVIFYNLPSGEYLLYEMKENSHIDAAPQAYLIYVYPNGTVTVNGESAGSYKVYYDKPIELCFYYTDL